MTNFFLDAQNNPLKPFLSMLGIFIGALWIYTRNAKKNKKKDDNRKDDNNKMV